jgi:hypothetical protein
MCIGVPGQAQMPMMLTGDMTETMTAFNPMLMDFMGYWTQPMNLPSLLHHRRGI